MMDKLGLTTDEDKREEWTPAPMLGVHEAPSEEERKNAAVQNLLFMRVYGMRTWVSSSRTTASSCPGGAKRTTTDSYDAVRVHNAQAEDHLETGRRVTSRRVRILRLGLRQRHGSPSPQHLRAARVPRGTSGDMEEQATPFTATSSGEAEWVAAYFTAKAVETHYLLEDLGLNIEEPSKVFMDCQADDENEKQHDGF